MAKLSDDGPEYDETELAMMALVKKIKRNLTPDAQEEVIEELQEVVMRHCRQAKASRTTQPTAAAGSAQQLSPAPTTTIPQLPALQTTTIAQMAPPQPTTIPALAIPQSSTIPDYNPLGTINEDDDNILRRLQFHEM